MFQTEVVEKKRTHFIRNVPDRSCREKESTFYVHDFPGNRAVDEMMSKNIVEQDRLQTHTQTM
jgi:hypothetical protein